MFMNMLPLLTLTHPLAALGAFDSERLLVTFGPQKLHMEIKCLNGLVFS